MPRASQPRCAAPAGLRQPPPWTAVLGIVQKPFAVSHQLPGDAEPPFALPQLIFPAVPFPGRGLFRLVAVKVLRSALFVAASGHPPALPFLGDGILAEESAAAHPPAPLAVLPHKNRPSPLDDRQYQPDRASWCRLQSQRRPV